MAKPKIVLPEREKTDQWIKDTIKYYSNHYRQSVADMEVDVTCYNYYHNIHDGSEFHYLTKIGDKTLPARLTHIPLQRYLLHSLIGDYSARGFVFSTFLDDQDSIGEKRAAQIKYYFEQWELLMKQTMFANTEQIKAINDQIQQISQFIQKEPESSEEAQKQVQMREQLPAINVQFSMITDMLSKKNVFIEKELKKLDQFMKYSYKDMKEVVAQKLLKTLYKKLNLKGKGVDSFTNGRITGKELYYVNYDCDNNKLEFEPLTSLEVVYPSIGGMKWIQDGPWVKTQSFMSSEEIIVEYGDQIKADYGVEALEKIEDMHPTDNATFVATSQGAMLSGQPTSGVYTGTGILVEKVYYVSPVIVNVKYSPNKHNGDYFRHFLDSFKEVVDMKDYEYYSGLYRNKMDPKDTKKKSDVEEYDSRKGQYIKKKYSSDLYEGVIINNEYIVNHRKSPVVLRDRDNYAKVKLPVVGEAFNNITRRPYSLIWATKPLQDLYSIFHYHRELMLNLAGTKSFIFDRSQKPTEMSDTQWEEQKKLGTINIQTTDENGNPVKTTFNQWSMLDLSVSPAIQYLDNILNGIKETMGEIIGVPRQRIGAVVNSDQVGTFEQSLNQAFIVTEILFYKSDEVMAQACTQLLNLAIKYAYKDGGLFQYVSNDLSNEIVKVGKEFFKDIKFDVSVLNNSEETKQLKELKEILFTGYKDGQILYNDLIGLYPFDSATELKTKVNYFSERAQELREKMQQQDAENQQALQAQQIKLAQEFEGFWKGKELELKQLQEKANQEREAAKLQLEQQRMMLDQHKIETDKYLKLFELVNEKESEDKVIDANVYSSNLQAQVQLLSMKINALIAMEKDSIQKSLGEKKIAADMKTKKLVKEHASDK